MARRGNKSARPAQGNNSRKRLVIRTFQAFRRDGRVLPSRKA